MAFFGVKGPGTAAYLHKLAIFREESYFAFMIDMNITEGRKGWFLLEVEPLLPELWKLGAFLFPLSLLSASWIGWWSFLPAVITGLMLGSIIFWWGRLYYWLIVLGARRHVPSAKIRYANKRLLRQLEVV